MMQLERGIRISVLPRFRPTLLARAELYLNSGVERSEDCFTARDDWKLPNQEEWRLLTAQEAAVPVNRSDRIELFEIPSHLHKQWHATAQQLPTHSAGRSEEYERFVASLASFFLFKKVPVENCSFTVLATEPPHRSAFAGPGSLAGLRIGSAPESPLLAVNLGDGPTALVVLNLPIRRMRELMVTKGMKEELPSDITQRFMELFPDYPLVRLVLPSRHGVRFFPDAVAHEGARANQNGLDVVLRITGTAKLDLQSGARDFLFRSAGRL